LPQLEGQRETGAYPNQRAHHADGSDDSLPEVADVDVSSASRSVRSREVGAEKVRERHAHLVRGARVPDHRADGIPLSQRVHRAHGDRFLPRPEPCLRKHSGAHPALEGDVMETIPHEPLVESEVLVGSERGDDAPATRVGENTGAKLLHHQRVGRPVPVLGRVERGVSLHFYFQRKDAKARRRKEENPIQRKVATWKEIGTTTGSTCS
jgi:hypothetical protein